VGWWRWAVPQLRPAVRTLFRAMMLTTAVRIPLPTGGCSGRVDVSLPRLRWSCHGTLSLLRWLWQPPAGVSVVQSAVSQLRRERPGMRRLRPRNGPPTWSNAERARGAPKPSVGLQRRTKTCQGDPVPRLFRRRSLEATQDSSCHPRHQGVATRGPNACKHDADDQISSTPLHRHRDHG